MPMEPQDQNQLKQALESARKAVLDAGQKYFEIYQKSQSPFVPGKSYVPVTAKKLYPEDLGALLDSSMDLWLTTGRFGKQFETEIAASFGRKIPGLLVNSGSSANLVAVSALGSPLLSKMGSSPLQPGDEVITVAAGFPTTVNPIIQNGWVPVFVDVDRETLNALPETVMQAKSPRTRAVILAHALGNPYRADLLAEWCKKEKLILIEDCCDALGAKIAGQPAGSFGEFATVSFYPAHHITMGEGGAVMARTPQWRRIAESIRDWGRDCWCEPGKDNTCTRRYDWKLGDLPYGYDHKYTYSHRGYNLKVTDMQAAIGLSQLARVGEFIARRRQNYQTLFEGVKNSPVLSKGLQVVQETPGTEASWFGFPLHCADGLDRNKIVRFLEERKVGSRLMFGGNLIKQPSMQGVNYRVAGELTNTDSIMNSTFWLGVHPGLTSAHLQYMLEQLEAAVKS